MLEQSHHDPVSAQAHWVIDFLFKEMTFSRRYLHTNLCFMSSGTAALVWQHSRIICLCFAHFPFRPGIHYLKPHLTQSSIDQKGWWAKLKLSKRCCFQEWLLWVISMMDPWALWHSPVICVVEIHTVNTLCMRFSHPWPFPYTSLGFTMIYSLAGTCAWWCIHCPSGAGPGCQFYHFIFTSIIKLLCWVTA